MSDRCKSPNKPKTSKRTEKSDIIKKKITAKDIEKWEVAELSSNIEPRSKPSSVFEKLEEKRKTKHEKLLQEFARRLHEVNVETEKNIKMSSVELKAHVKDFDDKLNEILNNINKPEVVSYCKSIFVQIQAKANEYKTQQQNLINELHQDLNKFEDQRAKKNEQIFQISCSEISKVGYFLPYEIQMFTEHEILKINKLSLNNRRCYEDLKLTLTLVTEQMFKSFMDKVFCIREHWIQKNFSQNLPIEDEKEENINKTESGVFVRLEVNGQELPLKLNENGFNMCTTTEWTKNVMEVIATLSHQQENLINLFKKTLKAIYEGFPAETEDIKTELCSIECLIWKKREIREIKFQAPECESVEIFYNLEMFWQEVLPVVQNNMITFMQFLKNVGELWRRHLERICESKKLILKVLEKAETNNQPVLEDLEIKLNLSMDALRQEHNEEKMEKGYEAVVTTLEALKDKYESMYLEEVSVVEDFHKMMVLEADVLSADIKEFTNELYPPGKNLNSYQWVSHIKIAPIEKPIVNEICFINQKIQDLRLWKNGVCIALENLSNRTREPLQNRAKNWVNKVIKNLSEKRTLQLELTEKRFPRIRIEIYEKRLAELKSHEEALDTHKQTISFVMKQLQENFQTLLEKESKKVENLEENLVELEEKALSENRPGVIRGNEIMLGRRKSEMETSMKEAFERFRVECETKVSDLQQSNIKFMKSIKLFYEGGNYSVEEGKSYIEKLEALDKEITEEMKNIDKDSRKEETEMTKKIGAMLNPVIALYALLYEETLFHQETQQRIRNFVQDIREMTTTFRLDFEFLSNQCGTLCRRLKLSKVPDDEEKIWNFIIEILYRNVNSLIYPISLQESLGSSTKERFESEEGEGIGSPCCCAGKFPVTFDSKSLVLRTSEKGKNLTCTDYRDKLCVKPAPDDQTFFAVVNNTFWEEMGFLQEIACDFYKRIQGRKIIRENLISNNYDQFIDKILIKFRYFNTQLQQFWLQLILMFLPLMGNIKHLANSYLERELKDYENVTVQALENFSRNFETCIETQKCENLKDLKDLDKKLLPLHGYPHNAELLNVLEEEVVRKTATQKIEWGESFKKFKSEIKCFRVRHFQQKIEISRIEMIYSKFRNTIFSDDLGNNLLNAIIDCCDKFISSNQSPESSSFGKEFEEEETDKGEIPVEHKLDLLLSETDQQPSTHKFLKQVREIIDYERSTDIRPSICPPCSDTSEEIFQGEDFCKKYCKEKLNLLLEIINVEQQVDEILQKLNETVQKVKGFADYTEKTYEEELYKWLNQWKVNVNNVLKLYTVMYEEKEKPVEVTLQSSGE